MCGKRETASDDSDAVISPTVIIEVLSATTEASDRGEKFAHYQQLPSLQEYVLVNHGQRRVEVFRRGEDLARRYLPFEGGEALALESLGVTLDVDELYADPNA